MKNEEARRVLEGMGAKEAEDGLEFDVYYGDAGGLHRCLVTKESASIDGEYTADQLEALVMWMRDPSAFVSAKEERRLEDVLPPFMAALVRSYPPPITPLLFSRPRLFPSSPTIFNIHPTRIVEPHISIKDGYGRTLSTLTPYGVIVE